MFFVYVLALVGLVALLAVAGWVIRVGWDAPPEAGADDPYADALTSAARLQAQAWEAVHELSEQSRREDSG